jgi:hypothetical protein
LVLNSIVQGGEPEELDITYHCKHKGLVGVTVTIPILPHGRIVFTIPKMCSGPSLPRGNVVPGLNVGTKPGLTDVVKDGVTAKSFMLPGCTIVSFFLFFFFLTYSTIVCIHYSNGLMVPHDEETTTFYIQK